MIWWSLACAAMRALPGGGTEGGNTSGGTRFGGDDSGTATDDTAVTDCDATALLWSTDVSNEFGTTPFYSGQTITLWVLVANPCANAIEVVLSSDCIFTTVALTLPYGGGVETTAVPDCAKKASILTVEAGAGASQSYDAGTLYTQGNYTYELETTATGAPSVLSGSFTIL